MATQPIARQVAADMQSASFIREMFEQGLRLKAQYGADAICDFSLGNPNATPPAAFFEALRAVATSGDPAAHRYMPNAGHDDARSAVARFLTHEYGLTFDAGGVVLTSGAAGAANIALKSILDPGDEVIVLAPYFPEYRFYIQQAGGRMVVVETTADFQLDVPAIGRVLTDRTRAVLLNTPNNPTGAVYHDEDLKALGALLAQFEQRRQPAKPADVGPPPTTADGAADVGPPPPAGSGARPLYLLCDDVYRRIIYDAGRCPVPAAHYPRSLVLSSYSKDVSIPGERLGYVAVATHVPQREPLLAALTMLNRTLGFVNAPALMQRVIARCADALCDISMYKQNRDLLCDALRSYGYDVTVPGGALYLFPKSPIPDDVAFIRALLDQRILAVPGRGFGGAGHFRLAYCVERKVVERALEGFRLAREKVR
jgi:aspartate aminotransferase